MALEGWMLEFHALLLKWFQSHAGSLNIYDTPQALVRQARTESLLDTCMHWWFVFFGVFSSLSGLHTMIVLKGVGRLGYDSPSFIFL